MPRFFVTEQEINLDGLRGKLLRTGIAETSAVAAIGRLKALNPDVDFTRLAAGTVLLVPDTPDLKEGASTSLGGETFEAFVKEVDTRLRISSARVKEGFERILLDRTSVSAVLKTAAVKRLVESDPVLKKQLESADARFKEDERRAQAEQKLLEATQKQAIEELTALARLFE